MSELDLKKNPILDELKAKSFKIAIIGTEGSGKTTIFDNLMVQKHDNERGPYMFFFKKIEVGHLRYRIQVVDTKGSNISDTNMKTDIADAVGFILVFSIASKESFTNGKKLLSEVWKSRDRKRFPLVIVGNKSDLEGERCISTADGYTLAMSWYADYKEICAFRLDEVMNVFVQIIKEIVRPDEQITPSLRESGKKRRCCDIA